MCYYWPSFPHSHPGQGHCGDTVSNHPQTCDALCLLFWLLGISSLVAFISAFSLDQTHTHTYTLKHRQHKHTCVYNYRLDTETQTCTGNTGVSGAEDTMSSTIGDGVSRHHVLPLELPVHLLPEHFRRQPEAASSAACVIVERRQLVDV